MSPVKASAEPLSLPYLNEISAAARFAGFREETYGTIDGFPLLAFTRRTPGPRPRIYLSAGCHGDEPAGPATLLELMERGYFDHRATWFICPLMNPTGLLQGSRENNVGIDLNRDYLRPRSVEIASHIRWLEYQPTFDLSLCLHEDWESSGFYLYELNPSKRPSFAEPAIKAVSSICPIELAEMIDGRAGKDGIIRPIDDPSLRDPWPEAIYLLRYHTDLCFTTETPSARPLSQRVAAQSAAINTIVDGVVRRHSASVS